MAMDKKILLGVIGEKLEIIQEQFSIIKEYDGKIPVIEIDLLMSNVRDLYELFITLQQENRGGIAEAAPRPEPARVTETPPPPVVEDVREDIPEIPVSFRSPSILGFEPVVEEAPRHLPSAPCSSSAGRLSQRMRSWNPNQ